MLFKWKKIRAFSIHSDNNYLHLLHANYSVNFHNDFLLASPYLVSLVIVEMLLSTSLALKS